jgi:hypothetical protein
MSTPLTSPAISSVETERKLIELLNEWFRRYLTGLPQTSGRVFEPAEVEFANTNVSQPMIREWVCNGTAIVTSVAHNYWHGQMIVLPAMPTPPSGLVPGTAYWVLRLNDETFSLHASQAHALANTSPKLLPATPGFTHNLPCLHAVITGWRNQSARWLSGTPRDVSSDSQLALGDAGERELCQDLILGIYCRAVNSGNLTNSADWLSRRLAASVKELLESEDYLFPLAQKGVHLRLARGPITSALSGADTRKDADQTQTRVLMVECGLRTVVER